MQFQIQFFSHFSRTTIRALNQTIFIASRDSVFFLIKHLPTPIAVRARCEPNIAATVTAKPIQHPPNLKPNQAKSSPTQPETHRWFDWRGLMIGKAFVWWFDDQWSAWFDDLSTAVVRWSMAIEEWFDQMKKGRVRWEWPKPRNKERRRENKLLK